MKNRIIKHLALAGILSAVLTMAPSGLAQAQGDCCIALPPANGVTANVAAYYPDYLSAESYFAVTLLNSVGVIPAGTYSGWCIDAQTAIDPYPAQGVAPPGGTTYGGALYSTCNPSELAQIPDHGGSPPVGPPPIVTVATWNKLNYLINHRAGYFYWDVQTAINTLIGGPPVNNDPGFEIIPNHPDKVQELLDAANAHGANYQIQCGEKVGVVMVITTPPGLPPSGFQQLVLIEVPCACPCDGQIGDFVWNDLNGNGCQDANEPGIQGVQVNLYAGCGPNATLVGTTATDINGKYLFDDLCPGPYTVSFNTPAGFTRTTAHANCNLGGKPATETDSDCDCAGGTDCGICVTLTTANPVDLSIDCGYKCDGQIGDFVWQDLNGNGCQDAGEPGIQGVKVDLYSGCGSGGTLIASTNTDNTGHYSFGGLCLGTYTVSFNTPAGFTRTTTHANCNIGGLPSTETDSDCDCTGGVGCGICVMLTTVKPVDLSIDCGYVPSPPGLKLFKSADRSFVLPGGTVVYSYVVTNTGGLTITNVTVVDDNGTQDFSGDDFVVGTVSALPAGESRIFSVTNTPPQTLCTTISGTNVIAGTLFTTILGSGDIQVTYVQRNLNDNRYGTGATAATGWSGGHSFNNLTGSDKAEFRFRDSKGSVVLDFYVDYISAAASKTFPSGTATYPSGFGTLGVNGGDGSMVTGNAANVLFATTSLTTNLQKSQFQSGYTVNSPPETSPNSGTSILTGWDYNNSYTVTVSKNAFGTNGFGSVSIADQHNSPAKIGSNQTTPTNCNNCVMNVAVATGKAAGSSLTAMATATVCLGTPPPPALKLIKAADKTVIQPGDSVTYTYTVSNIGGVTLTNVTVIDDNGTPGNASDDFIVGIVPSLAPNASASLAATKTLAGPPTDPQTLCTTINGSNITAGLLFTTVLGSGDIQVTYVQQNLNDNRYGTGATAATGWSGGHSFNNLTGSDKAEFRFRDSKGSVVLDFYVDYISAAASKTFPSGTATYPSGFGTLGVNGGDGSLITGNAANVLFATTSLTTNLQKSQFQSGYTVNSPPETSPNSGTSILTGWDYNNSYTVTVSKNAFGTNGFGSVSIADQHNSPAKIGSNQTTPTNCAPCVVNVAQAVAMAGTNRVTSSPATARVCFGPSTSTTTGGGCTAKFWKDHAALWTGYVPDAVINQTFVNATKQVCAGYGDAGNKKFKEALGWRTTTGRLPDAFKNLMREAVAALLNAANPQVNYPATQAEIIVMVNDALTSCSVAELVSLTDELAAANNAGSPLCREAAMESIQGPTNSN